MFDRLVEFRGSMPTQDGRPAMLIRAKERGYEATKRQLNDEAV